MKFSIGYIAHDKSVNEKYIKSCLENLKGEFDVITTTSEKCPAENYNDIIDRSENEWIILTHEDVTFTPNLLECVESTISQLKSSGEKIACLGMVGIEFGEGESVKWSEDNNIYRLQTCDCCFIIVKKSNKTRFDPKTFDGLHLYVEDYCTTALDEGDVFTILMNGFEGKNHSVLDDGSKIISHHSYTLNRLGGAWGDYHKYKCKLRQKWNRHIKTT
jgi:hypothetical protein